MCIKLIEMLVGTFDWERSESCQFTKYKLNQYYDWHCDGWDKPYDRKDPNNPEHGRIRKLSMTCQLTDGSEYKGGELEFDFRNYDPHMRDESKHRIQCKENITKRFYHCISFICMA